MGPLKLIIVALMLSGLVSCATKKTSKEIIISFGANDPLGQYPPCAGSDNSRWHNCYGIHVLRDPGDELNGYSAEGVHKDGKNFERMVSRNPKTGVICKKNRSANDVNEVAEICEKNGVIVSRQVFVNGERSLERERQLFNQEMSKECLSLGFKENTPEMGNCILRLRELERNNQTPQVAQPSQNKPSTADQLEGWAQILRGVQGAGQAVRPNPSTNLPTTGVLCLKSSEFTSGVYKTCVYKCVGGETTQTVSAGQSCPPNARF